MRLNFATLLTQGQVEQVHASSLEVLEQVGVLVRHPRAQAILVRYGCRLDGETGIVKFPRQVVEHFRAAFPPKFTFHGRDPDYDRTVPDDGPLFMTGSSAPNILDPLTGQVRPARSDDMARIAHLVNELPAIDLFSVAVLAEDAPLGHFSLSRYYPARKNCLKPVRGNAPDLADVQSLLKLGALVAGSDAAYRARPLITHHYCCLVSPLTLDFDSTEMMLYLTEQGLPGYATVVPNAGLTAPLTLLGTLVQGNAEFLAWATLQQKVRPRTPLIYSALPTVADMRSGAYASGGIECGLITMGAAQMARFYNVPSAGYVGLTNAQLADAQAGWEKSLSPLAAVLAGVDVINVSGLIDALMTFDYAMLAIDNEIAAMIKQIQRGFQFDQENLGVDLIAAVGPAGSFIEHPHTLAHMRTCALIPEIADRSPRRVWEEKGSLDARQRAMRRVREILAHNNPAVFSADEDARIRKEFPGLVAGDSKPLPIPGLLAARSVSIG